MKASDIVIVIGAVTALVVSLATLSTAVLSLLNFFANARRDRASAERDKVMAAVAKGVDGLTTQATVSARGQADAEIATARLEGKAEGVAEERANPMSSAGT
jgi:hypothetical protein